jgi:hypothetical protein
VHGAGLGLSDAFTPAPEVIEGNRTAANGGIGVVKEADIGLVTDRAIAPEWAVANQEGDDRSGRLNLGFVFEFLVEADAVHGLLMSEPSLILSIIVML